MLLIGYLPFDSEDKQQIIDKTIHADPSFKDKGWAKIDDKAIELIKGTLEKKKM